MVITFSYQQHSCCPEGLFSHVSQLPVCHVLQHPQHQYLSISSSLCPCHTHSISHTCNSLRLFLLACKLCSDWLAARWCSALRLSSGVFRPTCPVPASLRCLFPEKPASYAPLWDHVFRDSAAEPPCLGPSRHLFTQWTSPPSSLDHETACSVHSLQIQLIPSHEQRYALTGLRIWNAVCLRLATVLSSGLQNKVQLNNYN